jgi:hypothetical protein
MNCYSERDRRDIHILTLSTKRKKKQKREIYCYYFNSSLKNHCDYNWYRSGDCPQSQVNLSKTSIRREFIKHIGNEFESMVVADIEGDSATAPRIDREMGTEYLQYKVATSLAIAIFLYSFSGSEKKGVSLQRLRLAFLRPDVPPAIVGDAIRRLEEELWFLYFDKALYYFLNQPNLNRVIIDREELIKDEEIEDEIKAAIEKALTSEFEVYFWPKANSDIPDTKKIKLIILSPHYLSGSAAANDFLEGMLILVDI